jgi:hypothetical protein
MVKLDASSAVVGMHPNWRPFNMFGCSVHMLASSTGRGMSDRHEWIFKFCASMGTDCWFRSSVHMLARWTEASSAHTGSELSSYCR